MAKAEKQFSVVGQRVNRVEGYDKVTGEANYVADIKLPGLLFGRILRSPYAHARILNIDTSKAEKVRFFPTSIPSPSAKHAMSAKRLPPSQRLTRILPKKRWI
jgi:CO/xanthine dehydrogenase Mo-binding subunit